MDGVKFKKQVRIYRKFRSCGWIKFLNLWTVEGLLNESVVTAFKKSIPLKIFEMFPFYVSALWIYHLSRNIYGYIFLRQLTILLVFQRINFEVLADAVAPKSLQSYLTLCDPVDGSPPGSVRQVLKKLICYSETVMFR